MGKVFEGKVPQLILLLIPDLRLQKIALGSNPCQKGEDEERNYLF